MTPARTRFTDAYYRRLARATNVTAVLMMAFGLLGGIMSLKAVLAGSRQDDYWNAAFFLGFALAAFLARKVALWWYRLVYKGAHGAYPDD